MRDHDTPLPVRAPLERRHVVLTAAAASLGLIFAAGEAGAHISDHLVFLYVLPVILVSLELGARAGLAMSLASAALVAGWSLTGRDHAGAVTFGVEIITIATCAAITGRFSTRMHDGRRRQHQLLSSALELAGRSDHDPLPVLIARRAMQLVPAQGIEVTIDGYGPARLGELSGEPVRVPLQAGGGELGAIRATPPAGRRFGRDEHMALELLALHASVSAEHDRLSVLERERTALHVELSSAHGMLAEQGRRLGLLFDSQETERTEIARELHDETAQALTAIQLGLHAVEQNLNSQPSRLQVEHLRTALARTLRELRELAVGLRPPALDQLGLKPALESLVMRASETSGQPVALELNHLDHIPGALHTTVYRLVDDMIDALGGALSVRVSLCAGEQELRIEVVRSEPPRRDAPSPALLARIRSRLDLSAGALSVGLDDHQRLVASIPLT